MERHEIVTRDRLHAHLVRRPTVRVVAVDPLGEGARRDAGGLRLGEGERRERLGPEQFELRRRERRTQRGIGEELEGDALVVREHGGAHREEILSGGGTERSADAFDRRGDLIGGAITRALGEQAGDHLRRAGAAGRIVEGTARHRERERQHGLLLAHHDDHAHAVREDRLGERRELRGLERERGGWTRREGRRLRGERRRDERERGGSESARGEECPRRGARGGAHHLASGTITSVSELSGRRYVPATRRRSASVTAS